MKFLDRLRDGLLSFIGGAFITAGCMSGVGVSEATRWIGMLIGGCLAVIVISLIGVKSE